MNPLHLPLLPGIPLLLIIAGIAICSHFGPEYFGGDDFDVHPPQ